MAKSKKILIYIIHGYFSSARKMREVEALAQKTYPNADVINETSPLRWPYSLRRAPSLVLSHISRIDQLTAKKKYDQIFLLGHSTGGLLAQRVLVEAGTRETTWRRNPRNQYEHKLEGALRGQKLYRPWSKKVTKLILMASMSKGWSTENTQNGLQGLAWSLGAFIGHVLPKFLRPTIFDFRKGSPFIVQTRLRGIDYTPAPGQNLQVTQLIGSVDGLVSPTDSLDMLMPRTKNRDADDTGFMLIQVPYSTHSTICNLTADGLNKKLIGTGHKLFEAQKKRFTTRTGILRAVLQGDRRLLGNYQMTENHLLDELPQRSGDQDTDIAFIIHGIRDRGFWTKKIGARIKRIAAFAGKPFQTRTPTYGYFPILPFLTPWYRLAKVEWMMNEYANLRAAYPDARIHFVGHSNGTYLCAKGLEEYPCVKFDRIMFAGSVVRSNFPWTKLMNAGRVKGLFNAPATRDIVVAAFPYGLRFLRWIFDLGGAGHRGFTNPDGDKRIFQLDQHKGKSVPMRFYKGNHKAARTEEHWSEIAKYIVNNELPTLNKGVYKPRRNPIAVGIGYASVVLFPLLILGVAFFTVYTFGVALETTTFGITNIPSLIGGEMVNAAAWVNQGIKMIPGYAPISDFIATEWEEMQPGGRWLFFLGWLLFIRFVAIRV